MTSYTQEEAQKQYQKYFNQDIDELLQMSEDEAKEAMQVGQNHYGDLEIENYEHLDDMKTERARLWRNLDENIEQGEARVQIDYSGPENNHTWETVLEIH